jgi:hypothetical protein
MNISQFSPECHLLYLYFEGVPQHKKVTRKNMCELVEGLKSRDLRIYFPQYWDHETVRKFKLEFGDKIDEDDIFYYLSRLENLLLLRNEKNIHWIEKINIFHFYGLLRIFGKNNKEISISHIDNLIKHRKKKIKTLIDISALNTKYVVEERDTKNTIDIISNIEDNPGLIRDFGHYQIFYHNGIYNCINEFSMDLNKKGKVPIAHSVLALIVLSELYYKNQPEIKEMIMDRLYSHLNNKVKIKIDESSKKTQNFFSL